MQNSNGDLIYFSRVALKINDEIGLKKYFIPKNKKKIRRNNSFLNKRENDLDEKEETKDSFFNNDIFGISPKNNKNNKPTSALNLSQDNYLIEKRYKYYKKHLDKLKINDQLKKNKDYHKIILEPNIDSIKRRITSVPKWEYMTGRTGRRENPEIKSNSVIINSKPENNPFCEKLLKTFMIFKRKNKFKKIPKINSCILQPKTDSNNHQKKDIKRETVSNKSFIEKHEKTIKRISSCIINRRIKEKIRLYFDPNLTSSEPLRINNRKYGPMSKYISKYTKVSPKKKFPEIPKKTMIKNFKSKKLGLNSEEISFINSYLETKKLKAVQKNVKIKKINITTITKRDKKIPIKLYKNRCIHSSMDNINNSDIFKDNISRIKSFNSYINKSILNSHAKLNGKNHSFNTIKKKFPFYFINYDRLNKYDFAKFDNVTYKMY